MKQEQIKNLYKKNLTENQFTLDSLIEVVNYVELDIYQEIHHRLTTIKSSANLDNELSDFLERISLYINELNKNK